MTAEQRYKILVESLRLAAAPADRQLSSVPDFASVTDEIATAYGEAYLLVSRLIAAGLVSPDAAEVLSEMDRAFSGMPADGSIASPMSLNSHEFWKHVRDIASDALDALGEEPGAPTMDHIRWVRGE